MIFRKKTGHTQEQQNQQSPHISLVRRIGRFFAALMRCILSPGKTHFSSTATGDSSCWADSEAGTVHGRLIQNKDSLKIQLNAVQAAPPEGWVRTIEHIGASKKHDGSNQ